MKTNSKSLKRLRYKIRDFIVDELLVYLTVFTAVAMVAYIFDKWIEALMFCISHTVIRMLFNKQFHFRKTAYCLTLTLVIIWFAIPATFSVELSLLSSIPIAFGISMIGFIVQDRIDLQAEVKQLERHCTDLVAKLNATATKDIYAMNEDELYEHCRSCGLDEEDCKIAYFLIIERLKGKELYNALPYSEATIKRKRLKIMSKIKKDVTTLDFPQA